MSRGELHEVKRSQAKFERAYQTYLDAAGQRDRAVVAALAAGEKIEPIARAAGVSRQTISRILREHRGK